MSKEIIKSLIGFGIQLLGKLIPAIGGFLGGPLGFVASFAISFLTGLLYDLIEKAARYGAIDAQVINDKNVTKAAQSELDKVQKTPGATDEERKKAIDAFVAAARKFGKFKVQ